LQHRSEPKQDDRSRYCYKLLCWILVVAAIVSAEDTHAQHLLQVVPPGNLVLDGYRAECFGSRTEIISAGAGGGYAWFNWDRSAVILNDDDFRPLPTFLKLFVYAHECGHRVYGPNEDTADCFAAKVGRQQGWFPHWSFPMIVRMFANSPGDWTHRPGPARVHNIAACHADPSPP
jgi:hypothetical protein